jgi:hypothetical protein
MVPNFNEEKAMAAAALLLKLSGGQADKYWLNKVMYYIERQSLLKTGQPVFFDRLFSVPWAPIASAVNDAIDNSEYPFGGEWNAHILLHDKTVKLLQDADLESLSDFEEKLITEAFNKFKGWSFPQLRDYFHNLPEYTDTKSRIEINYEEILTKENVDPASVSDAIQNMAYLAWLEK